MPATTNHADAFLHGLSSFWLALFNDLADVKALYEGGAVVLGQAYLDLLTETLNVGVLDAPLFNKQAFTHLVIKETDLTWSGTRWVYALPQTFGALPQLTNKVILADSELELDLDYDFTYTHVLFYVNPTNYDDYLDGVAKPLQGFGSAYINERFGGILTDPGVADWFAAGVRNGDTITVVPKNAPTTSTTHTIALVRPAHVLISNDTPLPLLMPNLGDWVITRGGSPILSNTSGTFTGKFGLALTQKILQVSMWAMDAFVDNYALYERFGYLLGDKQRSSEVYRAYIRGLMQLYLLGPTLERVESGLNVIAGLPVIQNETETLVSYDAGLVDDGIDGEITGTDLFTTLTYTFTPNDVGGFIIIKTAANAVNINVHKIIAFISGTTVQLEALIPLVPETWLTWEFTRTYQQTVVTYARTYSYAYNLPVRDDIKDPANWGVLVLRAFETLTETVRVVDYIEDPAWWHDIIIPEALLENRPTFYRTVSADVFPVVIGDPNLFIGDPDFYVGADERGEVVPAPHKHNAAFVLMDKFLKAHMFLVEISPQLDLTGLLIFEMQELVRSVKPSHTFLYFQPFTKMNDLVTVEDIFGELVPRIALAGELFELIPTDLTIGSGWHVGDYWKFSGASGGGIVAVSVPLPGYTAIVIGGADPFVTEPAQPYPNVTMLDRALLVDAHP